MAYFSNIQAVEDIVEFALNLQAQWDNNFRILCSLQLILFRKMSYDTGL